MAKCFLFIPVFICVFLFLNAHEGHHIHQNSFSLKTFFNQIGYVHLILVHFPIALVVMTVIAECLDLYSPSSLYDHAAQFMLFSVAILVIPTVLAGLAFGYGQMYDENALYYYTWHQYLGLLTAGLIWLTAYLRWDYKRRYSHSLKKYYVSLILTFGCLISTASSVDV